jgi:hypothetical protein
LRAGRSGLGVSVLDRLHYVSLAGFGATARTRELGDWREDIEWEQRLGGVCAAGYMLKR